MNSQTASPVDVSNTSSIRPAQLAGLGLTGLMVASWIGALTYLTQLSSAHWQATLLVPAAVLTFLGGFYFAQRRTNFDSAWKTWLIGLIMPPITHRVLVEGCAVGFAGLAGSLIGWIAEPGQIVTTSFFFNSALLVATWIWSIFTSSDLRGLEVQEGEIPDESQSMRFFETPDMLRSSDRLTHFDRLRNRWITGIVVLAILITILHLIRLPLGIDLVGYDGEIGLPILESVVYVFAGLVLISANQLIRMTASWEVERMIIPRGLTSRWLGSGLAIVSGALALAFLIPTGYGNFVLELLKLLEPVIMFLVAIGLFIGVLLIAVLSLPFRLFPSEERMTSAHSSAFIPPTLQDQASNLTVVDALKAIAGWVLLVAALYFVTRYFWHCRHDLRLRDVFSDFIRLSYLAIAGLVLLVRGSLEFGGEVARLTRNRILGREISVRPVWRPSIRLRELDARGWLEYMILSVFSRAQKLGHYRPAGITAAEYATRLSQDLPVIEPQLSRLVDRFHQVRYGEAVISYEQLGEAKIWWGYLKRHLQQAYRTGLRRRDGVERSVERSSVERSIHESH